MHKKTATTFVFWALLLLSLSIFLLGKIPFLANANGIATFFTAPIQHMSFSFFHWRSESEQIRVLQEEKTYLQKKLIDQKKLEADNKALQDQFKLNKPTSATLLPAQVIGAPGFIPGVSQPHELILNVGANNGIYQGQAVVVNNNLIGKISRVSYGLSVVLPIQATQISLTAKTVETNATGIVVSNGSGGLHLDGVVLSDSLKKGDYVVTKGDISANASGIPPDIIIGKIISIDKKPSALFQIAKIQPQVDLSKITTVFIVYYKN